MIHFLITWFLSAILLLLTSRIIDGFEIPNLTTALLASIVIGLLNVFIRPIISLFSLPVNILTLGAFTFIINASILKMADGLIGGMYIEGWGSAILAALLLAALQIIVSLIFPPRRKIFGRD